MNHTAIVSLLLGIALLLLGRRLFWLFVGVAGYEHPRAGQPRPIHCHPLQKGELLSFTSEALNALETSVGRLADDIKRQTAITESF